MPEICETPPELIITKPMQMKPISKVSKLFSRLSKLKTVDAYSRRSIPRVSFAIDGSFTVFNFQKSSEKVQLYRCQLPKTTSAPDFLPQVNRIDESLVPRVRPEITDHVKDKSINKLHHLIHCLFGKLQVREEFFLDNARQDVKLEFIRKRRLRVHANRFCCPWGAAGRTFFKNFKK